MLGASVLIVTLCCIVNSVLKHFGIIWFDALGAAIGFLTSRVYYFKKSSKPMKILDLALKGKSSN